MEVQIADRTAEVELIEKNGNGIRLSVDGKAYDLDMVMTDRGICSVLCDGRSYDMEVERREGGKNFTVNSRFASYEVSIVDAQARYLRNRRRDDTRQDNDLCAPMPGKVVRVMVQPGDRVAAGDTLLVFEAMKMQSNLKVTGDCTVREILVAEGETVAGGALLVKLDVLQNESDNHGKE